MFKFRKKVWLPIIGVAILGIVTLTSTLCLQKIGFYLYHRMVIHSSQYEMSLVTQNDVELLSTSNNSIIKNDVQSKFHWLLANTVDTMPRSELYLAINDLQKHDYTEATTQLTRYQQDNLRQKNSDIKTFKNYLILFDIFIIIAVSLMIALLVSVGWLVISEITKKNKELDVTQNVTVETLGALAEYRDLETGHHIHRTKEYVRLLAKHLQSHPRFHQYLTDEMIDKLYKSAPLHDVGKVGVPDRILLKPGKLTEEEFEAMKMHTVYGDMILNHAVSALGSSSYLAVAQEMAFTHHERWDGKGYPQGLKEEEIPISGRLMALADVYDALISKRVYKAAMPHHQVVELILQESGKAFDPDITKAFYDVKEQFLETANRLRDD